MPGTRWISVLKLFCCYTAVHVLGFLIVLTCLLRIYVDLCMMYILLFMLLICTLNDSKDTTSTCMCSILSKKRSLYSFHITIVGILDTEQCLNFNVL